MGHAVTMPKYVHGGLAVLMLCVCSVAVAQQESSRWSAAEIASLPQYCQDRLSRDRDRMQRWSQTLGRSNAIHLHHYCYGLIYMHRTATEFDRGKQQRHARGAIKEFNYVLKRWPQNFPLYREAQMHKIQMEALAQ